MSPKFPAARPRRLRQSAGIRRMVRDVHLSTSDLIAPLFVVPGSATRQAIASMPGVERVSVDEAVRDATALFDAGIPAVLLFGIPIGKDATGSESWSPHGIVQNAVQAIKAAVPELVVITDVCLCEYTSHGHCGVVDANGVLQNDKTRELLARVALSHAKAGADIVAPSAMIDGMVGVIRSALNVSGYEHTAIMSYSVKYASSFYGPFRDAAGGAPQFGDRRSHQMDPATRRDAAREADLDVDEGADFLMVKPALAYLDIISAVHEQHPQVPLAAYNVSGEYAMVKAGAAAGILEEQDAVLEILHACKRAGADLIISYHARDVATWFSQS